MNLTVIAVYGPTLDAENEMLIVAEDGNARPGLAVMARRHILAKFVLGSTYANGNRLVNFASANRLVVFITRIQHPQDPL